jgi:hypothetical protein
MKTPAFKKTPGIKKKARSGLRHHKENIEGITYKSNCAFLTDSAVPINEDDDEWNLEEDVGKVPIVQLDP